MLRLIKSGFRLVRYAKYVLFAAIIHEFSSNITNLDADQLLSHIADFIGTFLE